MTQVLSMEKAAHALTRNGFMVTHCETGAEAAEAFLRSLSAGQRVGIGGSVTVQQLGLAESLQAAGHQVLWHWLVPPEEQPATRREAMQADHYICSVNALTQDGRLVEMDGTGNRIGALCFGPKQVTLFIGKNKLCGAGLLAATTRIKRIACPMNTKRLNLQTPCAASGSCDESHCENSLCRCLLSLDRPFPWQQVHIYLINEDLGY